MVDWSPPGRVLIRRTAIVGGFLVAMVFGAAFQPIGLWADQSGVVTLAGCLGGVAGLASATVTLALFGLTALVLGAAVARASDAVWGAATAAALLASASLFGEGSIALLRVADGPAVFLSLAVELAALGAVWAAGLFAMAWGWKRGASARDVGDRSQASSALAAMGPSCGAGLITAVVGGGLTYVLLRDPDAQQAVGALTVAFALGGLAARTAFPESGHRGIVLSPIFVGLAAYVWAFFEYATMQTVLADLYNRAFPPLATALPVHYVSAGTLGAALGIVWARTLAGDDVHAGLASA